MDTLVGGRGNCCFLFHNDAAIMDLGRLGLGAFFPCFQVEQFALPSFKHIWEISGTEFLPVLILKYGVYIYKEAFSSVQQLVLS